VTLARLQQPNPSLDANATMANIRVATALVEERSMASKSATSTSSRHSRNRSNRPAHSKIPTIQEEVNQPRANTAPGVDLRANIDKNRRGRDVAATSTSATVSTRSESFNVASTTIASMPLGHRPSDHGA
jgi:hypothetical protein